MSTQTIPIREDSHVEYLVRANNKLTPREIDVLQCAADGEDCKGTGQLLGISPFTVKQIRHKTFLKLGAETAAHAVAQALRRGIIS